MTLISSPPAKQAFACAVAGGAIFLLAMACAGLGVPEFSHRIHPLALRGALGLPGAVLFNFGVFILPGACLLLASRGVRQFLHGQGWWVRIGLTLVQLSVLAFALQGIVQMDQRGMEEISTRLHVSLWMLWWIAFVPGALLLALRAGRGKGFTALCICAAALVPLLAVFAPIGAWVGVAQRLAFLVWFGWWLGVAWLQQIAK